MFPIFLFGLYHVPVLVVHKCTLLPFFCCCQCSVTCGRGQMFRAVLCVGDGQIMEDGVCRVRRSNKPTSVKRCTFEECPHFKWVKDEWGEVGVFLKKIRHLETS